MVENKMDTGAQREIVDEVIRRRLSAKIEPSDIVDEMTRHGIDKEVAQLMLHINKNWFQYIK
ncbi:hypothetical protein [Candidatus Magnetaquicoccus inordinatus]|uniref:hypothetical protein n=1 Tax=Candidatus Magnetaquicoccus inordinatus TaxID=2496818 RepID=UPI001291FAEE|nr:hypothetical protein [Candidatus Magnetaquicoccus inordinatus]